MVVLASFHVVKLIAGKRAGVCFAFGLFSLHLHHDLCRYGCMDGNDGGMKQDWYDDDALASALII